MAKTSELALIAAGEADAAADFVPLVTGADLENKRMTVQALVSRGMSGLLNLVAGTEVDGASTYSWTLRDLTELSLEGTDASLTGVSTLYVDSTDLTLRGTGAFKIRTPEVHSATAAEGGALVLTDATEGNSEFSSILTVDNTLKGWAASQSFTFTTASRDADGVITTAEVQWPDGSLGTYTVTEKNATHLSVDAFTVTHTDTGKTLTQPQITRDAAGRIIAQPPITIA